MIRETRFLISRRPFAVDLATLRIIERCGQQGPYYDCRIGAVWFRRRNGVTVLVRPNQKRHNRPAPMFDLPRIGEYAPNNVLIRTADGDLTVRPFRGLRRTHG